MAETENGAAAQNQTPQIQMKILGQFIRDMSFENNVAQKGVQGEITPDIQVQVSIDAKKRPVENQYEVIIMELDYGGIFHIENVPDEQMHPFLLIECPRMLFPFARRIVSDITRDGGFPPLNLDNIDFVALYRQTLLQRQAAAAQQAGSETPTN